LLFGVVFGLRPGRCVSGEAEDATNAAETPPRLAGRPPVMTSIYTRDLALGALVGTAPGLPRRIGTLA
jgi:hypothetical protein